MYDYEEPSLLDLEDVAGGQEGESDPKPGCNTSGNGPTCAVDGCNTSGNAFIPKPPELV